MPYLEYEQINEKGEVFGGCGYKHQNQTKQTYIKFHVNDNPKFIKMGESMQFGGNLSVCKDQNQKPNSNL